jgi:hypothetical protein
MEENADTGLEIKLENLCLSYYWSDYLSFSNIKMMGSPSSINTKITVSEPRAE